MATEGVFPKSDGDVLYASEANKFAFVTPVYSSTGSRVYNLDANANATIGSFVINSLNSGLGYFSVIYNPLSAGATHQAKAYLSITTLGTSYGWNNDYSTYDTLGNFSDEGLIKTMIFPFYSGITVLKANAKKNTNAGSIILSNALVFVNGIIACSGTI